MSNDSKINLNKFAKTELLGIIYDAKQLLRDVEDKVKAQKNDKK